MPEQDKKLVAHMQTTAEREIKAKKARLSGRGGGGGDDGALGGGRRTEADEGEAGISKALRTFDAMMEGACRLAHVLPATVSHSLLVSSLCTDC